MTINNNPMNPVPLWPSKDFWYCERVTNHGAMQHPIVPTGMFPKMALTMSGADMPESDTRSVTLTMSGNNEFVCSGEISADKTHCTLGGIYYYISFTAVDGGYAMAIRPTRTFKIYQVYMGAEHTAASQAIIPKGTLEAGSAQVYHYFDGDDVVTFTMSALDLTYRTTLKAKVYVRRHMDDAVVGNSGGYELTGYVEGCGQFATVNHAGCMWLGGTTLPYIGFKDGLYYCEVVIGDITYFTEPFLWLTNLNRCIHVTFRRSEPIVTTDNCLVFEYDGAVQNLEAWLPGLLMMPPFTFEEDVEDIDGRKFMRKQVSYHTERCEFFCSSYFAEAIRLLWHCDKRTINHSTYCGRVEYMPRPVVSWNNDNHLCNVVVEFQGDTVVQTNGSAVLYSGDNDSEHSSFDNSFDSSFN